VLQPPGRVLVVGESAEPAQALRAQGAEVLGLPGPAARWTWPG
jgi:hypothetical protein